MTALSIQDAALRSGLTEPTLRIYEEVGLIGPIARDPGSGHRRYRPACGRWESASRTCAPTRPVADVRDVADAHLKAADGVDAAGQRYLLLAGGPTITWLGLAQAIRDHLCAADPNVTLREAPGDDPAPLTIHNDRAKRELAWQPRPAHVTIRFPRGHARSTRPG